MIALCIVLLLMRFAQGQNIPAFSFTGLQGEKITPEIVEKNKPLLIFFFDPYCDHCHHQAEWIVERKAEFEAVQMIWVTTNDTEENEVFEKTFFAGWANVTVCMDPDYLFDSWFGFSDIPSIQCYDKNGNYITTFQAEQAADILLKTIRKE